MNEVMKKYLSNLEIILEPKSIDELTDDDIFELDVFHVQNVYMTTMNDDYFLGMRANHFVIEEGYSEQHGNTTVYLVSANHKGTRLQTLLLDDQQPAFEK